MRDKLQLPPTFTLDACRHGGMTELEEAGLTDGQGRALSAHQTQQAYQGYAKRTMKRALVATRKRHAHRLANAAGTEFQNGGPSAFQSGRHSVLGRSFANPATEKPAKAIQPDHACLHQRVAIGLSSQIGQIRP